MGNGINDHWKDDEDRIDHLVKRTQPDNKSAAEARRRIEQIKERQRLREMESDPLMDTLIF